MTTMDSKQTIKEVMTFWTDAMTSHNNGDYVNSLEQYGQIKEKSSRIFYNMGCANIKLNQYAEAIKCFTMSVEKDQHSAIAFFQRGVLYLNKKRFGEAMSDFATSQKLFRGNTFINYQQLGLRFKLHLCEVLYNMALTKILMGEESRAEKLLIECRHDIENKHKHKILAAHEYLQGRVTRPEYLQPMTISANLIFSPPKDVIDNLNRRSVPRMARVVSSSNFRDSDPSFNGQQRVEEIKTEELQKALYKPSTPLVTVRRFLKKPGQRRDRSKSQAFLFGQYGLKGSQSMNDIRVRSKSHGILPDLLPQTIFANLRKRTSSTLSINKSASELQFVRNSYLRRDYRRQRRESMGSIFGNTLSPVNTALSKSFDILTAVAVPVDINSGFSPIGLDHEHISRSSSVSTDQIDVTDVFIDLKDVGKSLSEKSDDDTLETKFTVVEKPKCVFTLEDSYDTTNSVTGTESNDAQSDLKSVDSEMERSEDSETERSVDSKTKRSVDSDIQGYSSKHESARRRIIPPPPPYPPPPLPPHIVIMV